MIGKNAIGVIAGARDLARPTRMLLSLTCEPLKFCDTPENNSNLISTYGAYSISYRYNRRGEVKMQPKKYSIRLDFGLGYIKCRSYYDLKEQAKSNDHARFILEFTNIDEKMFDIAHHNEGMQIPFCFDVVKYNDMMRAKLGVEDESEYAMVFNSFKPYMGCAWEEGPDGSYTLVDKRRVKGECD